MSKVEPTGADRTGMAVGVGCGIALAIGEILALTWRTAVPADVAAAIVVLDIGILSMVGLMSAALCRQPATVGFWVAAATMTAVIYPAAAGILMRAAFARGAIGWVWLPLTTLGSSLAIALAMGLLIALLLSSWITAQGQAKRWEPWTIGCLVGVIGAELVTIANAVYLKPLLSLRGLAGTVLLFLMILVALRGLLSLWRLMPKGVTYGAPSLAVGAILAVNVRLPATSPAKPPVHAQDRPSVILIVLDTLRADHLSAYGYAHRTSPNLNRLAVESDLFNHAVSPSTWTLPAHASIFTGMSLRRHGVRYRAGGGTDASSPFVRLNPEIPTLAELLAAKGYATAAFVSNCWYLTRDTGLGRGFSTYEATPRSVAFVRPAFGALISALMPDRYATFIRPFRSAGEINAAAIKWIDEHGHAPFFLFLNYMETHWPYEAPASYRRGGLPDAHSDFRVPWDPYQRLTEAVQKRGHHITATERQHLESSYDAALAHLDHELGELFDALRQRGLYNDTLIIVTSDHGELFGEHDAIGHGGDPYEGVTHVPLLIRYPHAKAGRHVVGPVSTRRIFSVVLEQVGIGGPTLPADTQEPVVSEVYTLPSRSTDRGHSRIRRAIYHGARKLIASPDGDAVVYDVTVDPDEQTDLSEQSPDKRGELLARLEDWLQSEPDATRAHASRDLDPATLEALRALGYLR